jgi:hypothetical protein
VLAGMKRQCNLSRRQARGYKIVQNSAYENLQSQVEEFKKAKSYKNQTNTYDEAVCINKFIGFVHVGLFKNETGHSLRSNQFGSPCIAIYDHEQS